MAEENEYNFAEECKSGGMNEGSVFCGSSATQSVTSASLQNDIDCLTIALNTVASDRDRLLEDRCSDRARIIQLNAELLQKESEINKIDRIEEKIDELHRKFDVVEKNTASRHAAEEEVKTDLADKVREIQRLKIEFAKEKKIREEENKELRKQIHNCQRTNDDLKQEVFNKMLLLSEWENKFDLLRQENADLRRQMFRLSSQSSSSLVNCFSCGNGFDPNDTQENDCHYHPLPPMGYTQWRRWPVAEKVDQHRYHTYRYYACCNTLSSQRPKGCIVGRHHVSWNINLCAIFQENERFMENDEQSPIIL